MKILVVDDSKFSRKRVVSAIAELGYEIFQAGDGAEGFAIFEQMQPDLVVSDLLMPNVDGIGLLKMIRESGSQTPVIVVSADIQESSQTICSKLGIVTFLNKPFKPAQLQDAVKGALNSANNGVVAQKTEVNND